MPPQQSPSGNYFNNQPVGGNRLSDTPKQPKRKPKTESVRNAKILDNFQNLLAPDRRLKFITGFTLILFSLLLVAAFISFLFSGMEDQSLVDNLTDASLLANAEETENVSGVVGAWLAELFVQKSFGLSAFFIPVILSITGLRLITGLKILKLNRLITLFMFCAAWGGAFVGYALYLAKAETTFGFICGGFGYQLALSINALIGIVTLPFLAATFLLFYIFHFNFEGIANWVDATTNKLKAKNTEASGITDPNATINQVESLTDDTLQNQLNESLDGFPTVSEEEFDILSDIDNSPPAVITNTTKRRVDLQDIPLEIEIPTSLQPFGENNTLAEDLLENPIEIVGLADVVDDAFRQSIDEGGNSVPYGRIGTPYDPTLDLAYYKYPTIDLLTDSGNDNAVAINEEELNEYKNNIIQTLRHFKIEITSIKATVGPTVTLFHIIPEPGTRINRIKSLEDDIALSMAALGIRIIAPMRGQGTIGIEVPNKNRMRVSIRQVLNTDAFLKSKMELPVVLGKTISNEVFVVDLATMPHLLMAGATGQGKSVGINVLLTSLIYKKHPSQLKLVLVDPKKVELSVYSRIEKHFLASLPDADEAIITDNKKVINTLNSLCIEMDNRYNLLKEAGCRNVLEYNKKFIARHLLPTKGHKYLPYIVLVIDELADLMMTAGKEVETPIARLAQLARAIGIHLVVATQRPSVNVITGLIKANFPARLSFKVTSKIDSRTILDTGGADQLVGMGDMLLSFGSEVKRLQCPFISTEEVDNIVDFVANQTGFGHAYYLPEYEGEQQEDSGSNFDASTDNLDPLFAEAARLVVGMQNGSVSNIQRKMELGFNRAGRIMDQLEHFNIVGPNKGSKPRAINFPDEYALENHLSEILKKR